MKKLLLLAAFLALPAFAQVEVEPPVCKNGVPHYYDSTHVAQDFCINFLKAKDEYDCENKMHKLKKDKKLQAAMQTFINKRNRFCVGK